MSDVVKLTSNVIVSGAMNVQHMAGEIIDLAGIGDGGTSGEPLSTSLVERGLAVATDQAPTHLWGKGAKTNVRGGLPIDGDEKGDTTPESSHNLAHAPTTAQDDIQDNVVTPVEHATPLGAAADAQGTSVSQANAAAQANQPTADEIAATAASVN